LPFFILAYDSASTATRSPLGCNPFRGEPESAVNLGRQCGPHFSKLRLGPCPRKGEIAGHLQGSGIGQRAECRRGVPGAHIFDEAEHDLLVFFHAHNVHLALSIGSVQQAQVTAVAAGATLYFLNQFIALLSRFSGGYAYGLAYEGPYIGFSPNEENAVLQLGVKYTECVG
jgi:hypothetical protein